MWQAAQSTRASFSPFDCDTRPQLDRRGAQASVTTTRLHRDGEGANMELNDIWTFE